MIKKTIVIVILLCIVVSGITYSQESLVTKLQEFITTVYSDYAAESFAEVYAVMHPRVQAMLSEAEYVDFQEHHFDRLSLAISEIEVGDVRENPRVPRPLQELFAEDEELYVFGVELDYRAHFVSGVRLNQGISKTVYVALVNSGTDEESMYLLWDPSSVEE